MGGSIRRSALAQVLDFETPANNDWMAVGQFTVTENLHTRRPDIVLFVNGLPLGVIELKHADDENVTAWTAWRQLQNYRKALPTLLAFNEVLAVSDGVRSLVGTLTAERDDFRPWRTIGGEELAPAFLTELQVLIVTRWRRNIVQSRFFAEKLESSIRDYRSRATTAAQVIEELIQLARQMRQAQGRGDKLGLSDDELAFYDALDADDSAVRVLGNETLRTMVRELVETVHDNVKNDWMLRESVRVHLQTLVKRILRRYGYPAERQERAARTVLEQAESLFGG